MMKKSLLALTAALSFGYAAAQDTAPATTAAPAQAPNLTDVPAGHWAKDAIDRLVTRGIILGYPDGTFRGTQNLTRYEAAVIIARVLDQIRSGEVVVTPGDSTGISAEDLTALQNAVQELAADLTALGVRVSDLEENAVNRDDFSRLEARVEELAAAQGEATAVANIQTQIDELTARADDYDTLRADVDDNASSIAALNDLTVLLNQDILNLQDRVSAVEAAQADFVTRTDFDNLSGRVTAVDTRVTGVATRVTTLENAPKFSVTGNIDAGFGRINLISGGTTAQNFDVDRLTRQTFADGVFSSGVNCPGGAYAASGNAVSCTDTNNQTYGGGVGFGVKASNLTTANGTIVVNSAAVNFYTNNAWAVGNDVSVNVDNASANGTISGQKFDVTYQNGNSSFKFNDYLFANDADSEGAVARRGAVINIEATQLPLAPKLTVVAGNAKDNKGANILDGNYYGIRASVNPGGIGTVGVAYAQMDGAGANIGRSAFGVDYDVKFGPVGVKGAGVASIQNSTANFISSGGTVQNAFSNADYAFYTNVKADLGVVKLAANYRAVEAAYANGEAGMSANDAPYYLGAQGYKSSMPYAPDQVGFGGALATTLGPVTLAAFGDSDVPYNNGPRSTSFGVAAGVKFAGLSATGFYNRATLDNAIIHTDNGSFAYNSTAAYMDTALVPFAFSSTYGGMLRHDGAASDALVKGLSFTVANAYFYDDQVNDFQAYGSYSGTLGAVKIEPFARYHLLSTPNNANVTDNGATVRTYNTVKYGVKLSTTPLTGVPLQPSLFANFANRFTSYGSQPTVVGTSATELFGQAGITLNEFLVPNMKASIGYAYYQGFNLNASINASSASGATATYSATADRIYASPLGGASDPYSVSSTAFGTQSTQLQGVFGQLSWNGLAANYGMFWNRDLDTPSNSGIAQGFKVSYSFKF